MSTKKAAALLQQDEPQTKPNTRIVAQVPEDVKALRDLHERRHIPTVDVVEVVGTIYPKFDRYLLSRVEHGERTGVRLRDDAFEAVMEHFRECPSAAPETPRKPHRRKPYRVACRITGDAWLALQRALVRSGRTMQDYIEELVMKALKEEDHEQDV